MMIDQACEIKLPVILVVDDAKANINILMGILEDKYDVLVALDGETALEIANDEDVDLILLDIVMPNMDGFEVCKQLKLNQKTKDIPVVFMTSDNDTNTITQAYEVGGIDFISKPLVAIMIQNKIDYILKNRFERELKDRLTGIRDRKNFLENCHLKFEEQIENLRAVHIDIDDLHLINKQYGFEYGDRVINATVEAIKESICKHSIFGRTDANGFTIVCSLPTDEAVRYSIKFIKDSIQEKVLNTPNGDLKWSVSIGVGTKNSSMDTIEDLLNLSDEALKNAKSNGKDRIVYL